MHYNYKIADEISKRVSTYELAPFYSASGLHKFHYIIHVNVILKTSVYYPIVCRYDFFNMSPSCARPPVSAEESIVVDDTENWRSIMKDSESEVLDTVLKKLDENLYSK